MMQLTGSTTLDIAGCLCKLVNCTALCDTGHSTGLSVTINACRMHHQHIFLLLHCGNGGPRVSRLGRAHISVAPVKKVLLF